MIVALNLRARIITLALVTGLGCLWLLGPVLAAAPEAELWPRWQTHDQNSDLTLDHSVWGRFLKVFVKTDQAGATWVDYRNIRPTDRAMLDAYIAYLEGVRTRRLNRDAQMAFWINLYNALTVRLVFDHYPLKTIRDIDISPGWFEDGPWGAKLATVDGQKLSLDEIEHRILRPIWQDPRIHYAVNCASVGCPNLAPWAYTGARIDSQLDTAARSFVNHPRAVLVTGNGVQLSSLFKWYAQDFGDKDTNVLDHLRGYASSGLVSALSETTRINDYKYDWSLNDLRD